MRRTSTASTPLLLLTALVLALSCSSSDEGRCADVGDVCSCGADSVPSGIEKCPASYDCCARGTDGCTCAAPEFYLRVAKSCDDWIAFDNSTRVSSCP
mgnify:FL=1